MRFADDVGFYELNPFPGCNQICVSNHALIYAEERGKGLGQIQHQERLRKAEELGYDFIICSVRADNVVEITILKKNGWIMSHEFVSRETGNTVQIWGRAL